jgi:hypothetical protein
MGRRIAAVRFFACKGNRLASKPTHDHKKHWNAAARDLSDSCWNYDALSHRHRSNRNGNRGAGGGHFDFDRQVVKAASVRGARRRRRTTSWLQLYNHLPVYSAPTAAEISKTTMLSEIKIWIIARTFAQRASNGASVGPNVELCVNATNR